MSPHLFARGTPKTLEKMKRLRKQALADKDVRVALRAHAIVLSLENYSVSEVARILDVHRGSVHTWIRQWNLQGEAMLREGHRGGRPPFLSAGQREILADILESGPVAYGFLTGVWTSPLIGQVIEEEFQVGYHPGHVRKMLKAMGFSLQRPTSKAVQADRRQQRKWIHFSYPDLKKSPSGRGFGDL